MPSHICEILKKKKKKDTFLRNGNRLIDFGKNSWLPKGTGGGQGRVGWGLGMEMSEY